MPIQRISYSFRPSRRRLIILVLLLLVIIPVVAYFVIPLFTSSSVRAANTLPSPTRTSNLVGGLIKGNYNVTDPNPDIPTHYQQSTPHFAIGIGPNNLSEAFFNPTVTFDLRLPKGIREFTIATHDLCHSWWGDNGYGLHRPNQSPYIAIWGKEAYHSATKGVNKRHKVSGLRGLGERGVRSQLGRSVTASDVDCKNTPQNNKLKSLTVNVHWTLVPLETQTLNGTEYDLYKIEVGIREFGNYKLPSYEGWRINPQHPTSKATQRNHYYNQFKLDVVAPSNRILTLSQYNGVNNAKSNPAWMSHNSFFDDLDDYSGIISLANGIPYAPNMAINEESQELPANQNFSTAPWLDNRSDVINDSDLAPHMEPYAYAEAKTLRWGYGIGYNMDVDNADRSKFKGTTAKWQTEIIFALPCNAPDLVTSPSSSKRLSIRINDGLTDLVTGNAFDIPTDTKTRINALNFDPQIYVDWTDRNSNYIVQPTNSPINLAGITWNNGSNPLAGNDDFRGLWRNFTHTFESDRIYRVRITNINPQKFIQARIPFEDMIDVYQICERQVEIVCKESQLFVREMGGLANIGDDNIESEIKFWDTTTNQYLNQLPYTNFNDATVANQPYDHWYPVGSYSDPPAANAKVIADTITSQDYLANFADYELRWTGRWRQSSTSPSQGSTADATFLPITVGVDCLDIEGLPIRAEIRGTPGCQIEFTHLDARLWPSGERPPINLLINNNSSLSVNVTINGVAITRTAAGGRINQPDPPETPITIIDLTGASISQVATAKNWTFAISQYYDSNSTLQNFKDVDSVTKQLQNRPVLMDVDLSNLICVPPEPIPCTPAVDDIYTITRGGPFGGSLASRNIPYITSGWSTPSDPADSPVEILINASGTIGYTLPRYQLVQNDIETMLKKAMVNGAITDTSSSLTIDNLHPALLQPVYNSRNLQTGSFSYTFRPNDDSAGDPYPSPYWDSMYYNSPTYELSINVLRVDRLDTSGNNLAGQIGNSSPPSPTLNPGSNILLRANDSYISSSSAATIQAYRWDIDWTLTVTHNHTFMWYDTGLDMYGSFASDFHSLPLNMSATFSGSWSACTRSLIVQPPTCQISDAPGRYDNYLSEIKDEEFDPDVVGGSNRQLIEVFPVGRAISRTRVRVANFNPFDLQTNSSQHPQFDVQPASVYNSGQAPFNQLYSADAWNGSLDSYPSNYGGNIKYYLEPVGNGNNPTPNVINYPGKYETTWTVNWQTDTGYNQDWPSGSSNDWAGAEHEDNRCMPNANLSKYIYVYADPPTCRLEYKLFEVNDSQTQVSVTLTNPNAAPMAIEYAGYKIYRSGSTPPDNRVGSVASPPDIPANSQIKLTSSQNPIDENGIYRFVWAIRSAMGNEKWTTLDLPPYTTSPPTLAAVPGQNSWFADRNERITTLEPALNDHHQNGDLCTEARSIDVRPFFKVFYGSLAAGGYFGRSERYDACASDQVLRTSDQISHGTPAEGYVAAHADNNFGVLRGSSVEYSLQALNSVRAVYSASQRVAAPNPPNPPKGLTLGNMQALEAWGGSFGRENCLANYWREVEKLDIEPEPPNLRLDLSTLENNDRKRYSFGSNKSLKIVNGVGSNASLDLKATLFVDGDVFITEDIINNETNNLWYNPAQIGYIAIIARGNIYIDSKVTRVDALLVAYPRESSLTEGLIEEGGEIHTCYFYSGETNNALLEHFSQCDAQLTINGALIAQKVVLGRVFASVRQALTPTPPPVNSTELFNASDKDRLAQDADDWYTDVGDNDFGSAEIGYLLDKDVLQDDDDCSVSPDQQFCPDAASNISRGQIAIWLARALNGGNDPLPPLASTPTPFATTNASESWWPHVVFLVNQPDVGRKIYTALLYDGQPATQLSSIPSWGTTGDFALTAAADADRAWVAVLLKSAFKIPQAPQPLRLFEISPNNYVNYTDTDAYPLFVKSAINDITASRISTGAPRCTTLTFPTCNYAPSHTRKLWIAVLLARAMVWEERGQQFDALRRNNNNSNASEVINLLPEYFIGTPELPLFPEWFYKSDASIIKPPNF